MSYGLRNLYLVAILISLQDSARKAILEGCGRHGKPFEEFSAQRQLHEPSLDWALRDPPSTNITKVLARGLLPKDDLTYQVFPSYIDDCVVFQKVGSFNATH